jgi:hypothetical protein
VAFFLYQSALYQFLYQIEKPNGCPTLGGRARHLAGTGRCAAGSFNSYRRLFISSRIKLYRVTARSATWVRMGLRSSNPSFVPVLLTLAYLVDNGLVRAKALFILEAVAPEQLAQLVAFLGGKKIDMLVEKLKDLEIGVVFFEIVEEPVEPPAPLVEIALQAFSAISSAANPRDEFSELLCDRAIAAGLANEGQEAFPLRSFLAVAQLALRQLAHADGRENSSGVIHDPEAPQVCRPLEKTAFERVLQWPKLGQLGELLHNPVKVRSRACARHLSRDRREDCPRDLVVE